MATVSSAVAAVRDSRDSAAASAGVSKSTLAYAYIKERIEDSRYSPGYRLVLGTIAGELGVSVVPVREAIRLLEAEGLVQFERNVGAQVAMADPREYEVTMQTLSLVEGWATAASAPFMASEDVARARAINDRLAESLHHFDPVAFTRLNLDFHSVLFEHCPNPHILDLVDRGWARLRALRESTFSFVPGRAKESVAEHARILDLIERSADAVELEFAARNHRLATLDAFLAHERATHPAKAVSGRRVSPAPTAVPSGGHSRPGSKTTVDKESA
ncbi:MAG: GntR family transcriptional regulator [Cryobacterium sp.]|nr:GntR family transcriptional regulator [Cryobacterium sp.]